MKSNWASQEDLGGCLWMESREVRLQTGTKEKTVVESRGASDNKTGPGSVAWRVMNGRTPVGRWDGQGLVEKQLWGVQEAAESWRRQEAQLSIWESQHRGPEL